MDSPTETPVMNIRTAKIGDAGTIAEIHVRSWQQAYAGIVSQEHLDGLSIEQRRDQWRHNLSERKGFRTYAAEVDGTVVGFVSVGDSRDDDAPPNTAQVTAIYLCPDRWRHGVGRALWKKACAYASQGGAVTVTAWVLEENDSARALL